LGILGTRLFQRIIIVIIDGSDASYYKKNIG